MLGFWFGAGGRDTRKTYVWAGIPGGNASGDTGDEGLEGISPAWVLKKREVDAQDVDAW